MTAKPKQSRWDSAGWGVFVSALFVLIGPFLYAGHQFRSPVAPPLAPYAAGLVGAVVVAGLFTVLLNTILQARTGAPDDAEDQPEPRRKKGGRDA